MKLSYKIYTIHDYSFSESYHLIDEGQIENTKENLLRLILDTVEGEGYTFDDIDEDNSDIMFDGVVSEKGADLFYYLFDVEEHTGLNGFNFMFNMVD